MMPTIMFLDLSFKISIKRDSMLLALFSIVKSFLILIFKSFLEKIQIPPPTLFCLLNLVKLYPGIKILLSLSFSQVSVSAIIKNV